jgi:putative phage-type endonuclease
MEQGSPEWLALRCGKITGSRFGKVMALHKRTGKPNKPRLDLIATLRAELATGVPEYVEPNEYMEHGTNMEPLARKAYEFATDNACDVPAFVSHPTVAYVGYSPDGLVGNDGIIEIKSPFMEARHMRTVESQRVPDDYWWQVQGGLWVTGRLWCDFVSYFPEISVEIVRAERNESDIARLEAECAAVWAEVTNAQELSE